ncbi:hypothetical protein F0562_008264 [Nyssa sinensis]|uniref:C2H2-type domain-containing protein n=1 Tax=Nyssa sinensis TaxID=561372 RepID=A0A5J5A6M5_9ASTE|nr:hypothetical protein F0562_008264 [Nyssa sinensis]
MLPKLNSRLISKWKKIYLLEGGLCFIRVLEAEPFQGNGDKIKLPPSCFTELSEQGAFDKGPLHFRLSVIHQEAPSDMKAAERQNPGTTHAGVLEFTSEEGSVGLPPHVWSNLFPADPPKTSLIEVRYVWLPKGTYAKLQPDEFGFSDIPNHKAVLETSLRQHATLSQDDMLTVNHGALAYHLRVLELKPSSSVSVLETDIEVDIVGPDSASETTNQHVLKPLIFGMSESGIIEEGNYMLQHQSSECPLRLVTCRFCGDMVQAGTSAVDVRDRLRGLSEHESVCGSRTAPCDSCGRSVMLKEMDIHRIAVHQKTES